MDNFTDIVALSNQTIGFTTSDQAFIGILFSLLLLIGLGGNAGVCFLILHSLSHSVTNVFLFSLSLADLLVCLLCAPFSLLSDGLMLRWPFGAVLCRLVPFTQSLTVFLSALTHMTISCDRFMVVMFPMKSRMSVRTAWFIILKIWIISSLFASPIPIINQLVSRPPYEYCEEGWASDKSLVYSIFAMVTQYFIPVLFLISSYTAIIIKLWAYHPPGTRIENRDKIMAKSKKKMAKMAIIVATLYSLSQLPRHVLYMIGLLNQSFYSNPNILRLWIFSHFSSISATCYNPFIYVWMNKKFKEGFRDIFLCLFCCRAKVAQNVPDHSMTIKSRRMPLLDGKEIS